MSLIKLTEVGLEFAGTYLFRSINCSLEHNSRIGMIGSNGCGKTTLLKVMLNLLEPGEGAVSKAGSLHIGYLPQQPDFDLASSAEAYVRSARPDLDSLWEYIIRLSSMLSTSPDHDLIKQLHRTEETYQQAGGYSFDTEMKLVMTGLRFMPDTWNRSMASFSGGERTRLALARILLSNCDLLLLDEPTNHLDIAMLKWLEDYLSRQDTPYLVISHDRTFLDKTVSTVWHLENGALAITKGNYSSWAAARQIQLLEQERRWKQQQKWLAETRDFIARNIAGQKTKQAQGRLKLLNRTRLLQRPQDKQQIQLHLADSVRSGNDIYRLEELSFGIGKTFLASGVNLYCGYRDRVCLLGQNGSGKTSFLKLLLGDILPVKGKLKVGSNLIIGYYDQYHNELNESLTVYETLREVVPGATEGYVLSWLARFGFRGDDTGKYVSILSGGEKSRLYLMLLIHLCPNLLLLDEPTNHLDMDMMDGLLSALQEYDGTVIFVSHDRFFIQSLTKKYWVFHKHGFEGNSFPTISELDKPFDELITMAYSAPEEEKTKSAKVINRRKKKNPWVLEQLQADIEQHHQRQNALELALQEIQSKLSASETYADISIMRKLREDMTATEAELHHNKTTIDRLETQYLELSYD